jgi:hypothetical protein
VVPLSTAREARDTLTAHGLPYMSSKWPDTITTTRRAPSINRQVWDFLAQHALAGDPHYQIYNYTT